MRLPDGATPHQRNVHTLLCDLVYHQAMLLIRQEADHAKTCTDPNCRGKVVPWLEANVTSAETGVAILAILLQRFADRVAELDLLESVDGEPV